MLYSTFLFLHSWLRWVALGLLVASLVLAVQKNSSPKAAKLSLFTMISYDVQLLIGLLLYGGLSPKMAPIFADFGAAMKDSVSRFFAVEHLMGMVIAIALVHIGHALGKRASDGAAAAKKRLVFFSLALVVTLASIPWPFRQLSDQWFRGLF